MPDWLMATTAHGPADDGHVLLSEDGDVLARLVPGKRTTLPSTIAQSEAAPPQVTDGTRAEFAEPAPLPEGFTAADSTSLLGRWIPADAPAGSESHVHFHDDTRWSGSDGCNGLGGRWRVGREGSLLATGSYSTSIGCENIPVDNRLTRAARAGFEGDTLILLDRRSSELGRFRTAESRG